MNKAVAHFFLCKDSRKKHLIKENMFKRTILSVKDHLKANQENYFSRIVICFLIDLLSSQVIDWSVNLDVELENLRLDTGNASISLLSEVQTNLRLKHELSSSLLDISFC